ncbi:MAG: hypothetical protein R3Y08_00580 [Rikenellaceae bacterium]
MKKFYLLVAAAFCVASASAQNFGATDKKITANIGFGGGYGSPIGISYEQGVYDLGDDMFIAAGGYFGYSGYSEKYSGYKVNYSNIFIAAMGNWHYAGVNKLDLYAGIRLGYNVASANFADNSLNLDPLEAGGTAYSTHIGANYFLNHNWAINAEIGYGLANLNVGVSYKF